jgi:uncharacterized protein (TIGR02145 family)
MNHRFTRFLLFAFLFFPLFCFSQGEFNNWYFGMKAGVSFNTGFPVSFTTSQLLVPTGCSSNISDSLGNILFYSGGFDVYNRNNVIMPNGSILGMQCSVNYDQINLAVKQINDEQKYYLFTTACWQPGNSGVLRYSVIDMTLDGGNGAIPFGMNGIPIPGGTRAYRSVTGTRHHNNRDAWMVVRLQKFDSNYFSSYLVNSTGINFTPVFSNSLITIYPPPTVSHGIINLRISRDGSKLLASYDSIFEFCQFNDETGQVNPLFLVTLPDIDTIFQDPVNAAFSIDSKVLYISGNKRWGPEPRGNLYQYDATKTDSAQFVQSAVFLGNSAYAPALQLAPDGKIYCTIPFVDSLGVINNPSILGTGCDFQKNALNLKGKETGMGLPQFIERYYAIIHHTGHCQHSISFTPAIWPPADSIHWDFGDPGSGPDNFSNLLNPVHTFAIVGDHTIQLFVRHKDNRVDSAMQVVTVDESPMTNLGPDRTICIGDSVTWDAGYCFGCNYVWFDITSVPQIVGNSQTFTTGTAGIYKVNVSNQYNCNGADTVQLITQQVPIVTNNPLSKTICTGESTNITLTSNDPGANFYWTANLSSGNITGFSADSGIVINQILINNGSSAGIVTYHITPKIGSCIGNSVDFPVTITLRDTVQISISASANNVCAGTPVTFTATPTNGGVTPSYQWKVNGVNAEPNNANYTYNPASGDLVSCILTSSNTVCISNNPAASNTIQMIVNPLNPVSITISPSVNPVCSGTIVIYTATPGNGGTTPVYQWKVNGVIVGTNNPIYSYAPVNGDIVTCVLTSNIICPTGNPATSNIVTMTVNPNLPVSVSISASANPVCSGNTVTYTAAPVNGGNPPTFQWKINGNNVGTNSNTYAYNPVSGDLVSSILTSGIACPTGNPATSNTITMNVATSPLVTFPLCFDSITTTNAKPFKLKGGIPISGTYSGAGVNNGIFNPAIAGTGTHQITYSYTNVALCSAIAHYSLLVVNLPAIPCGSPLTDIRDNKVYQTVKIGSQCWMAEDLNYGYTIDESTNQRDNCIPEKYIRNSSSVIHNYYQWDELMNYDESISNQGLCPPAWHVPTEADWNTLFANYTNNAFAGSPLKYSGFSGFDALLNGVRHLNSTWDYQGFATFFWSSSVHGTTKARAHGMNETDPSVSAYPALRSNALSVRCLKD